jgi:hypothetical protein
MSHTPARRQSTTFSSRVAYPPGAAFSTPAAHMAPAKRPWSPSAVKTKRKSETTSAARAKATRVDTR